MRSVILDASVVLKWHLVDEEFSPVALSFLDGLVAGSLRIAAPSILGYEIANGLIVAMRRGRVSKGDVQKALEGFANIGIEFKDVLPLYPKLLHLCSAYNISAYDAAYLALAEHEHVFLITDDKKLFDSAKRSKWVKWIGDLR